MAEIQTVKNYIGGRWVASASRDVRDVHNPATGDVIARAPMATSAEVDQAVAAAQSAFPAWRNTPPPKRAALLLRLRELLMAHRADIARTLTTEHGKTLAESDLEIARAIDNLEVAAGTPSLMMGHLLEDVSAGIDEYCIRQPLGVFAALCPFNFPAMIPFWFMPYALATGNTYIVKPSPRVPLTMQKVYALLDQVGFPAGVINCLNGAEETARALCQHAGIKGISFVGSTPVGRQVYAMATASGKRVQAQAGAKNYSVVMPDAAFEKAIPNLIASAYDCSGQRCLALSCILAVGDAYPKVCDGLREAARAIRVGNGLNPDVTMGPVISRAAQERIEAVIASGVADGAKALLDGRGIKIEGYPNGYWVGPTLLSECSPQMKVAREEIFGPVLCVAPVASFDAALDVIHASPYGNAASIFTGSGKWAREFKHNVACGNIGVNVGVATPMAMFHFSGTKDSFFGDLHAQGEDAIRFFTEGAVVVERWF